jgi:tRNA-specific 2-thiouridylase
VRCNERIKFAAVLDRALALGFDAVVTGHHARLAGGGGDDPAGPRLLRSVDRAKDQSYVLGTLHPRQLRRALFPLGDSTKQQVRSEAAERGLAVAAKPDSHDICFIADGDTAAYLRRRLGAQPGPVVDQDGSVLGGHDGAFSFTVGQRRGLRLGRPGADGQPRYVLGVDPVSRVVAVGPAEALDVSRVQATDSTYTGPVRPCRAQLRAHGASVPARVVPGAAGALTVEFDRPVRGVAAGQAVVVYDEADERVLGGATISRVPAAAGVAGVTR